MPLDRIVHVEIMATDSIPADLPPMMEFKAKADKIIKERYGIEVEVIRARESYEEHFYRKREKGEKEGQIYGWPIVKGPWCNGDLKLKPLAKIERSRNTYLGIASDEPNRLHCLTDIKVSPLVEHGITEKIAYEIVKPLDLLSPIYTQSARGGVGSATISQSDSFDYSANNTRNIGS